MAHPKKIYIEKSSGKVDLFDESKLLRSLMRAGATVSGAKKVVKQLRGRLFDGATTHQIYEWAFDLLKESDASTATRYNLKNSIMELGPSGFPFEQFVAALLREEGYSTRVSVILEGKCVKHEVDVVAEKNGEMHLIECKYHNLQGTLCDVKIPLYIKSRFDDVLEVLVLNNKIKRNKVVGHIYTNTGFTSDAISYASCIGIGLTGWNFEEDNSLRYRLDQLRLYPVTVLTSLNKSDKLRLIEKGVVLCKEILKNPECLESAGIRLSRRVAAISEVEALCRH